MAATPDADAGIEMLEERDARALTEVMSVLDDIGRVRNAPDLYLVVSSSGSEYMVDHRTGSCECWDAVSRQGKCKHVRRVEFAIGEREIPEWVEDDAVDDQLGIHVDGGVSR